MPSPRTMTSRGQPHTMAALAEPMSRRLGGGRLLGTLGLSGRARPWPWAAGVRPTPTREAAGPAGPDFPVWGWTRTKPVTGQTCRPRSWQRGPLTTVYAEQVARPWQVPGPGGAGARSCQPVPDLSALVPTPTCLSPSDLLPRPSTLALHLLPDQRAVGGISSPTRDRPPFPCPSPFHSRAAPSRQRQGGGHGGSWAMTRHPASPGPHAGVLCSPLGPPLMAPGRGRTRR